MTVERYISSDSHVLEPANLWVEQMETGFRDQAPRVVHDPPGYTGDYWLFGDRKPATAVQGFFAGASRESYDEITDHLARARYAERLPGSYDPAARLQDMATNNGGTSRCGRQRRICICRSACMLLQGMGWKMTWPIHGTGMPVSITPPSVL